MENDISLRLAMSKPDKPTDHYFSATTETPSKPKTFTFQFNGRDLEVRTDRGVFSYGALDQGTKVLLEQVPAPADGPALDLGCGAGAIALALATHGTTVFAVDTNLRALELSKQNASNNGFGNVKVLPTNEVPDDQRFATIWSNPPIRIGKEALHDMLNQWLPRLLPDGEAWLVVQKNLGADSLHTWLQTVGYSVERTASRKGFRVLRVTHARAG
jgi:16S rRNA G1207 methylase RsmC